MSEQTKILMYILGCFYAVDFILFMVYFIYKPPGNFFGDNIYYLKIGVVYYIKNY